MNVDQGKLEAFMGKMIGHMTGGTICYSIWLGDELGLYREMAGSGPRSADSVAAKTGCNARLVREWLDGQAAGGLVSYNPAADTYELSPEAALALANDGSPVFVARAMNAIGSMYLDVQKVAAAFGQWGGRLGRAQPVLVLRDRWFFRTGYRTYLTTQWIPRWTGSRRSFGRVPEWPTWVRAGRPSWRWPPPTRARRSAGSTSTPRRSRRPAGGRPRREWAGEPDSRRRPRLATPGRSI